ncbi:MAG: PSD1 and planctomycete cytochrome C domain-containing protein [Armatimonadota bacterium]
MRFRSGLIVVSLCGIFGLGAAHALPMPKRSGSKRPVARAKPVAKAAAAKPAPPALSFERDVRPVLKAYCIDCHGGETTEAKLDLRLKRFLAKGGHSGPVIVARKPSESLLIKRMKSGTMPPVGKKVPPEQIAIVERWIAAGAPTARTEPLQLPPGIDITPEDRAYWFFQPVRRPTPPAFKPADRVRTPIDAFVLQRLRAKGLSFAPDADRRTLIRRATLDLTGLAPTPAEVDAFVGDARPDAYERLIDRLLASPQYGERWGRHWLDVAGYADSEGDGSADSPRPYAYKYRDYVIRSLNADKPFDQFLTEQLAGDELVPRPWTNLKPDQIEKLTATGFLRTAAHVGGDPASANQVVGDTLKIVSSSLLGLSVGCAQCHDHRYDPIPQVDYFRLRALFEPALNPAAWRGPAQRRLSLYTDEERARAAAVEAEVQKLQQAYNEKQARLVETAFEAELQKFPAEQREALRAAVKTPDDQRTAEQKQLVATNPKLLISPGVLYQYNQAAADELTRAMEAINKKRGERPPEEFVSVLDEVPGQVPTTHLFHRGDYRAPKEAVTPGDLTIAAPDGERLEIPADDASLPTTGRRLAWAKHLTSGKHPLVGRVLVNRVWLHHFGRGIVDTPGEFGKLGALPTHPELLDYLASLFTERAASHGIDRETERQSEGEKSSAAAEAASRSELSPTLRPSVSPSKLEGLGWSLKALHKTIMLSTVYRQSSVASAAARKIDTDGSLYSRFSVRRLDAESLRDRMLQAAGRLDPAQFGPPVPVVEDAVGQVAAKDDTPRRSVYLQVRRSQPISFLVAFDAPVMALNCERRQTTNSAPQALMLMNSDFTLAQAKHFAQRLRKEAPEGPERQVALAWSLAFCRPVTAEETAASVAYLQRQQELHKAAPGGEKLMPEQIQLSALTNFCQQLLSSNEFLYVD